MLDSFSPFLLFISGSIMLYYGTDFLINNSSLLAKHFNVPSIIVGVTILAFGTSLPELVVSIKAVYSNHPNLIIGNIIGSNISNICLVFGIVLLLFNYRIYNLPNVKKSIYFLIIISTIFSFFIFNYNQLNLIHGLILLFLLCIYLYIIFEYYFSSEKKQNYLNKNISIVKLFFFIMLGVLLVGFGSDLFLDGAVGLATNWGVSDAVIGLTIVALGTSIPELFVSIGSALKKEYEFVVGNVVGSNIINIVLVGGLTSSINVISFNSSYFFISNMILLFVTFLLILLLMKKLLVNRFLGLIFIVIYFVFLYLNFNINLIS